jgi:nicotinamidase-related amidase
LQWRKEFEVDKIVRSLENADDDDGGNDGNDGESIITTTDLATILRKENETGKIYVRGYDKDGRVSSDDNFLRLEYIFVKNQLCLTKY